MTLAIILATWFFASCIGVVVIGKCIAFGMGTNEPEFCFGNPPETISEKNDIAA